MELFDRALGGFFRRKVVNRPVDHRTQVKDSLSFYVEFPAGCTRAHVALFKKAIFLRGTGQHL